MAQFRTKVEDLDFSLHHLWQSEGMIKKFNKERKTKYCPLGRIFFFLVKAISVIITDVSFKHYDL